MISYAMKERRLFCQLGKRGFSFLCSGEMVHFLLFFLTIMWYNEENSYRRKNDDHLRNSVPGIRAEAGIY